MPSHLRRQHAASILINRIGCVGRGHAGSTVVAGAWKALIYWDWAVGI